MTLTEKLHKHAEKARAALGLTPIPLDEFDRRYEDFRTSCCRPDTILALVAVAEAANDLYVCPFCLATWGHVPEEHGPTDREFPRPHTADCPMTALNEKLEG